MKSFLWLAFVGLVAAANALTAHFGFVFSLATAGTFAAGLAFAVRDELHLRGGRRWVLSAILAGMLVALAWVAWFGSGGAPITPQRLALASGAALLVGELGDYAVFTPLRERSAMLAMLLSNTVGAILDSLLFLWLAGWFSWHDVSTQSVIKVAVTLPVIAVSLAARRAFRRPAVA
jgi:uncharacterized PurR-regulated membrane protein YhhQ (DUF165 family)